MAGNVLEFIVRAKDKASDVLDNIGEAGAGAADKISENWLAIGGGVTAAGGILAGAADAGVVSAGKLQAQLGLTSEETERVMATAKSVFSGGYAESLGEATQITGQLQQAIGLTGPELQNATKDVIRISDAFEHLGADPQIITEDLRTMRSAFPDKSDAEILDLIAQGFQSGAGMSGDLQDTLQEYPRFFSNIGLTGTDMMNFLNEGMQSGARNSDLLGDAVKEMGILVTETGSDAQGRLASIFGAEQSEEMIKNFTAGGEAGREAFFTILEGLNEIEDPIDKNAALIDIFGTKGEDLAGVFDELLPSFLATKDASQEVGDATSTLDAQYTGMGNTIDRWKRKFIAGALGPLGQVAAPATEAVTAFSGVGTALMGMQSMGLNVTGAFGKLGGVLKAAASPTKIMTAAQAALNLVMSANPVVLVVLAIAALAAGLVIAYQKSETFRDIVNGAFSAIQTVVQPVIDWFMSTVMPFFTTTLPEAFSSLAGKIGAVWSSISGGVTAAWELIKTVVMTAVQAVVAVVVPIFEGMKTAIVTVWNAISTAITTALGVIQTIITTVFNALLPIIQPIWSAIQTVITTAINVVRTVIETTLNALQTIWSTIWNAIKAVIDAVWGPIVSVVTTQINAAKTVVETVLGVLKGIWETVWGAVRDTAETIWNRIKEIIETAIGVVRDTIDRVTGTISEAWDQVWGAIRDTAQTIWDRVKEIVEGAIDAVKTKIDTVVGEIKSFWDETWGAVQTKVEEVMEAVQTAVDDKINAAKDAIDTAVETAKGYVEDGFEAMRKAVSDKFDDVVTLAEGIGGRITTAVGDLSKLLWDAGTEVIQGFIDGAKSLIPDLDGIFSGITGRIPDLKGPLSKDKVLLKPAGHAIMGGLIGSVKARIPELERTFVQVTDAITRPVMSSIARAKGPIVSVVTDFVKSVEEPLQKYMQAIGEDGDWLNDWLTHLPDSLQRMTKAFGLSAANMGLSGEEMQGVLDDFSKYIRAVLEDGDYLNDWLTHLPGPLSNVAKSIGLAITRLPDFKTELGKTGEEARKLTMEMRGLSIDLNGTSEEIALAVVKIGESIHSGLHDYITQAVADGDVLNENLQTLPEPIRQVAIEFAQGVINMGGSTSQVQSILSTFGDYIKAVITDGDAMNDWLSELPPPLQDLAKSLGIATAEIPDLQFGLEYLYGSLESIPGITDAAGMSFEEMATVIEEAMGKVKDSTKENMDQAASDAEAAIARIKESVMVNINDMRAKAEAQLTELWADAERQMDSVKAMYDRRLGEIQASIKYGLDPEVGKAQIADLKEYTDKQLHEIQTNAAEDAAAIRESLETNISQANETAQAKIAEIEASISEGTEAAADSTAENSDDMQQSFTDSLETMKSEALQRLGELQTIVSEALWGMKPDAIRAGLALGRGFIDGIQLTWPRLRQVGEATAQVVIDAINSQLDIASPSKVSRRQGEMAGQGLADGLRAMHGLVQRESDRLGEAATPTVGNRRMGMRSPLAMGLAAAGLTINFNNVTINARNEDEARQSATMFANTLTTTLRRRGAI